MSKKFEEVNEIDDQELNDFDDDQDVDVYEETKLEKACNAAKKGASFVWKGVKKAAIPVIIIGAVVVGGAYAWVKTHDGESGSEESGVPADQGGSDNE